MIKATLLPSFAGHGQSQRCYSCSTHCPPTTALVIKLLVDKMRVVPTLSSHVTRCKTRTHTEQHEDVCNADDTKVW